MAQVEFADEAVGDGIAVEDGAYGANGAFGSHGKALKGMSNGVPEVQRFADAAFSRVFLNNAFFHLHGVGQHAAELIVVDNVKVEVKQFLPHAVVRADEAVFQHFGIAGADVLMIHRTEKRGVENDTLGCAEDSNLVFQTAEVDACLATYRGIDHRQQGRGDVDVVESALKR